MRLRAKVGIFFLLLVTTSVLPFPPFSLSLTQMRTFCILNYAHFALSLPHCQHTTQQPVLPSFFVLSYSASLFMLFFMRTFLLLLPSCASEWERERDCEKYKEREKEKVLVRQHTRSRNVCTFGFWCFLSLFALSCVENEELLEGGLDTRKLIFNWNFTKLINFKISKILQNFAIPFLNSLLSEKDLLVCIWHDVWWMQNCLCEWSPFGESQWIEMSCKRMREREKGLDRIGDEVYGKI